MTRSGPGTATGAGPGAERLFEERYGRRPAGLWTAPGRVNLIGEHTDYNDGFALPFAIAAGVYVAAATRTDGVIALSSRQHGDAVIEVPLDSLQPGQPGGWAAYPAGMAWAIRRAGLGHGGHVPGGHAAGGVSLAIDADLPAGAGLSSSAALESAAGLAITDLWQLEVPPAELAGLGRHAENDFVGAPTGVMDQLAVLLSQAGHALLLDCRASTGVAVPFDPSRAGLELLVIDTRTRHELTGGGYGARRRACQEAATFLGLKALRDAGPDALAGLADPVLRRRARHVVTENQRVLDTAELLRAGRPAEVGPLLTASHVSLRDDFEVSWPEADACVEAALAAGAYGARMTGGGFGGSVIALMTAATSAAVAAAVTAGFAARGWTAPVISSVVPSDGARRLR